jgi:hypothetical protein
MGYCAKYTLFARQPTKVLLKRVSQWPPVGGMFGGSQGLPSAKTEVGAEARQSTKASHNKVFFTG